MVTSIDGLMLRRVMGRKTWGVPRPFGEDGWVMDHLTEQARIIVTTSDLHIVHEDRPEWRGNWHHASISRPEMPSYGDLALLKEAVWGPGGYAYQVFAAASEHVNIHARALHLWGRSDGRPLLPHFGALGTI